MMSDLSDGISVTGTGIAGAVPDTMVLQTGVEVTAADPGAAFTAAAAALDAVRAAVISAGVEAADLRTTQVALRPVHDRDGRVNGHEAALGLAVMVRDMGRSGSIIDQVTRAGGTHARLFGMQLEHSDPTELMSRARERAMADARDRAQELARLAGRSLGRCVAVAEPGASGPRPMMAARAGGGEMAVDPGQLEQSVSVLTRWEFGD